MEVVEIKKEIKQIIEKLPDETLSLVLKYLKGVESSDSDKVGLANNLNAILKEDTELLNRLAVN